MPAVPNAGADLADLLHDQIERALSTPPAYGSVGIVVHLVDGFPSRVEYVRNESCRQVPPRSDRGGRA